MKYRKPQLYKMFPSDIAGAACCSGDQASSGIACQAGPESIDGCKTGAAAGGRCTPGAAAGGDCGNGTGFGPVEPSAQK